MKRYSESYLDHVIEWQGKLFDLVDNGLDKSYDTIDFIKSYMLSDLRSKIDEGAPYFATMDSWELLDTLKKEGYVLKPGKSIGGFAPWWIEEFYACYQWFYAIPSSEVIQKVPLEFLLKSYNVLHDLDLKLAVERVGI